jgi:hypothetical protein
MTDLPGPAGLREDTSVSLALHDGKTAVECRVIGFHRTFVVLRHAASTHHLALQRAAFGYVMFDTPTSVAALRVEVVRFSEQDVTVQIVDRFDFTRQRSYSRLAASWPITLEPLLDGRFGDPILTSTANVSAGGAVVQCADAFPERQAFRTTLQLPGAAADVVCAAEALHSSEDTLAVRFVGLAAEAEAALGHAILNALAVRASPTHGIDPNVFHRAPEHERRQRIADKMIATAFADRVS